jgi:molecular chaperone GrpE
MDADKTRETEEPVDGPVKVVDRRWWITGETAAEPQPLRKPSYIEELERQLGEKDKAIQAHAARHRESAAEFEQVRARLRRDVERDVERARRALLADFLEVADNLERALAAAGDADENLAKGVQLVHSLLLGRFAAYGVRPMEPVGKPFDPALHDAVSLVAVEDQALDETVQAVVRQGYTIGADVLRPAGVVVGKYGERKSPTAGNRR